MFVAYHILHFKEDTPDHLCSDFCFMFMFMISLFIELDSKVLVSVKTIHVLFWFFKRHYWATCLLVITMNMFFLTSSFRPYSLRSLLTLSNNFCRPSELSVDKTISSPYCMLLITSLFIIRSRYTSLNK